jgi:DNA gyrase/topoisomerase IV subunit A
VPDVLITAETSQIRLHLSEIPQLSRGTQGVRAIKLPENSKIKEIAKI